MSTTTGIEWTDYTWNPVRGCTRVSRGCVNCYAEIMAARFSDPGLWGHGFAERVKLPGGSTDHRWTGKVELIRDALQLPLNWRGKKNPVRGAGARSLVFVNSTSDLFHEKLPRDDILKVLEVIRRADHLDFQILSKRPERAYEILTSYRRVLPNLWLGTSCEDQETANERIPHLLNTPAAVRFISAEPLLGLIDLRSAAPEGIIIDWLRGFNGSDPKIPGLDWVIAGGESGRGAEPMHEPWARALRNQCAAADVPFFFKQWGEYVPEDEAYDRDLKVIESGPASNGFYRVGKHLAGSLLSGVEHKSFPVRP